MPISDRECLKFVFTVTDCKDMNRGECERTIQISNFKLNHERKRTSMAHMMSASKVKERALFSV